MKRSILLSTSIIFLTLILCACGAGSPSFKVSANGESWYFGFGAEKIMPNENSAQPLYIAGYNSALSISGVLDHCTAKSLYISTGGSGILLIGIDCIALDSGTVKKIRASLSDIKNVDYINVYSTHTHAGPDTLGLWGETGIDGKNDDYMAELIKAAEACARKAMSNIKSGRLFYSKTETKGMFRDSRDPIVTDDNLYQLRFCADDGTGGARIYFYGAHAESLRGANSLLSRDFPGKLCDGMEEKTGDMCMFAPGAIGGLVMTKEFVYDTTAQAVENLEITSNKLIEYASSITSDIEKELSPNLSFVSEKFTVPLDNPAFLLYKTLGILSNDAVRYPGSATGYGVRTELNLLMLDDVAIALIPGEIFPELISGKAYGNANPEKPENPKPLYDIAKEHGVGELLIIGLANDELGYIVPPSDFLLNEKLPYIERTMDHKGEDHYEETNSVGPQCAPIIAETFEKAVKKIGK